MASKQMLNNRHRLVYKPSRDQVEFVQCPRQLILTLLVGIHSFYSPESCVQSYIGIEDHSQMLSYPFSSYIALDDAGGAFAAPPTQLHLEGIPFPCNFEH
jgi:hypothetical protein